MTPEILTFTDYKIRHGLSARWMVDDAILSPSGYEPASRKRQRTKTTEQSLNEYKQREAELRAEYDTLIAQGVVREPTSHERAISIARRTDETEQVLAARRVLSKKGINW